MEFSFEKIESLDSLLIPQTQQKSTSKIQSEAMQRYNGLYVQTTEEGIFGQLIKSNLYDDSVLVNLGDITFTTLWSLKIKNIIQKIGCTVNPKASVFQASNGKVFQKFVDPNLILLTAAVESASNDSIYAYIIDSYTGKQFYKILIEKVDLSQPIILLFRENLALITYTRKDKFSVRQETLSIEMMRKTIESDFLTTLKKILGKDETVQESNETINTHDVIFLTQTYVLTKKIKSMTCSRSLLNVSNRSILVTLENNQVFAVDQRLFSARRPIAKEPATPGAPVEIDPLLNSIYVDNELPPYNSIIIFDPKTLLNNSHVNEQVSNVLVSPTSHESTFLVCRVGLGIKCSKTYPDKTFDSLPPKFSYHLIFVFVIGIWFITFLLRKHVKSLQFKNKWLKEM